jgi:GH15 family glucan-1,4-alpha-glucosidase
MRFTALLQQLIWFLRPALGVLLLSNLWRMVQYLRRLFGQPRLPARSNHLAQADLESLEQHAVRIAAENLRAGIETRRLLDGQEKQVLNAGLRNFREPWARDFGFACLGLLALGEFEATRECLEVFLLNQAPSGQFPVKVHSTSVVDRYLHSLFDREQPISSPLRPKYTTAHNTVSLDGNALLINAVLEYATRTGDRDFASRHWEALQRALAWLEDYALEDDGLLYQDAFADWADTIGRQGRVLYTNVIYWKALDAMARAAPDLPGRQSAEEYALRRDQVAGSIHHHFWRPDLGYFITSQDFDILTSSGNLLAIAWGLADRDQSESILNVMAKEGMADPVPTRAANRPYPIRFVAFENRLIGLANYHTDAAWLWLGAWHVISALRIGREAEARALIGRLAQVIVRDGEIHEVYSPSGRYISNFWYTSEAPLTWSAGMVVYACSVFHQSLDGQASSPCVGDQLEISAETAPDSRRT